ASAGMSKKRLPTSLGIRNPERSKCHDGSSIQPSAEGEVSVSTITIGVDLAKDVFSVCSVNGPGRVLDRKDLRREAFSAYLVLLPAGSVVAMEACSGAHY